MKTISGLALAALIGAVWRTTKFCSQTIDGELADSAIIFAVIGILHCWAILPFSKMKGVNLLFFLLYNFAALIGFQGSGLDEMGGMLYFIIPSYIVLICMISQGMLWRINARNGKEQFTEK